MQANVNRSIDQFGPDAKKNAKQTTKKVAGLDVTIVEVEGSLRRYEAAKIERKAGRSSAAIVATPDIIIFSAAFHVRT